MTGLLSLIGVVLLAIGWDWLGVTRLAAYFTDFDYCYWPLSRRRQIGLGALVLAGIYEWAIIGSIGLLWLLVPFVILFAAWAVTALKDISAQRRDGYRVAPRYSDAD